MATFVFDTKWAEVLSECPAEVRLEVYEAIIRYASTGTLSELKPLARMAFGFVRLQIDEQAERMRLEASGRPLMPVNEKAPGTASSAGQPKERKEEKEKENPPAPLFRKKEKEKKKESGGGSNEPLSSSSKEENDPFEEAREENILVDWQALACYWNERRGAMPRLTVWSDRRKAAVRARARENGGMESVRLAIDKAAESDFLQGKNRRCFVADFDWVMKPSNFAKVTDGNYDNRENGAQGFDGETMNYVSGWGDAVRDNKKTGI